MKKDAQSVFQRLFSILALWLWKSYPHESHTYAVFSCFFLFPCWTVYENIATESGENDILPLLNAMNDYHLKSLSDKIKAAMTAMAKDGQFVSGKENQTYRKACYPPQCWNSSSFYNSQNIGVGLLCQEKVLP